MLFDTHCHLDASEFDSDREQVIARAQAAGVQAILIPAVEVANFDRVRTLAHSFAQGAYALGIHPMYVERAGPDDLKHLRESLTAHQHDPKLVAVGEIGLDFFIPDISHGAAREKQEHYYDAQLLLAKEFDLPVLLHVRRSQDTLLKYLRQRKVRGGLAHAFNGSLQQAEQFVSLGFALGMGGAMTYGRALQIRRLAQQIGLDALVLETDAPDIAPEWLTQNRRNEPVQVLRIAQVLAGLRGQDLQDVLQATSLTALRILPRLAQAIESN
jgi:TatD DNase family protein